MRRRVKKFFGLPIPAMLKQCLSMLPLTCLAWLYFLEIDDPGKKKMRSRFEGTIQWVTPRELPDLEKIQHKKLAFEQRFQNGDMCLLVRDKNNEPVAYEWFTKSPVHHESKYGIDINIPENALYAYDAFVLPPARMMGIWYEVRHYLAEWMKENNKEKLFSFVEFGNWNSLNVHLRYGYRLTNRITYLKLFGIQHTFNKSIDHSPGAVRALVNGHELV